MESGARAHRLERCVTLLVLSVLCGLQGGCGGGIPEKCPPVYSVASLTASRDGRAIAAGYQVAKRREVGDPYLVGTYFSGDTHCVTVDKPLKGELRLFDAQAGRRTSTLPELPSSAVGVCFAPDGKTLLAVADEVRLYDVNTGAIKVTLPADPPKIGHAVFSPDGSTLAAARGSEVHLLNAETGQTILRLPGHTDAVTCLSYSGNGRMLASGGTDGIINLWDAQAGTRRHTLTGHTGIVRSVRFAADGSTVVSGSNDRTVRIWDATTGALVRTLEGHLNLVTCVAVSSDSATLATASWDRTVKLWSAPTGVLLGTLSHADPVVAVEFLGNSHTVVTATFGEKVQIWSTQTGRVLKELR